MACGELGSEMGFTAQPSPSNAAMPARTDFSTSASRPSPKYSSGTPTVSPRTGFSRSAS